MNYWFTADSHFGHPGILKHRSQFATLDEMNNAIIAAYNSRVKPGDVVYHLGDVAWKAVDFVPFIRRLNGKLVILRGNHDPKNLHNLASVEVHYVKMISIDNQKIWLSHYAHRVWPSSHHGTWHLYGHSHGSLPDDPNALSMDIGIDCHPGFAPFSLDEIREHMSHKAYVPVDHHGSTDSESTGALR